MCRERRRVGYREAARWVRRSLCYSWLFICLPPPPFSLPSSPPSCQCACSCVWSTWPQFLLAVCFACCVFAYYSKRGKVPPTEPRAWEGVRDGGWGGTAFWKDDVCCAFNLEQQDICLARYLRCCFGPNLIANRFTGANLARNETDSAASSEWDDAAATCAPQPAAFGGNKFVFNLKTFHSSLAFCLFNLWRKEIFV